MSSCAPCVAINKGEAGGERKAVGAWSAQTQTEGVVTRFSYLLVHDKPQHDRPAALLGVLLLCPHWGSLVSPLVLTVCPYWPSPVLAASRCACGEAEWRFLPPPPPRLLKTQWPQLQDTGDVVTLHLVLSQGQLRPLNGAGDRPGGGGNTVKHCGPVCHPPRGTMRTCGLEPGANRLFTSVFFSSSHSFNIIDKSFFIKSKAFPPRCTKLKRHVPSGWQPGTAELSSAPGEQMGGKAGTSSMGSRGDGHRAAHCPLHGDSAGQEGSTCPPAPCKASVTFTTDQSAY